MSSERFGVICDFEGDVRFSQVGVNILVVKPAQPSCLYHRENAQEEAYGGLAVFAKPAKPVWPL